MGGDSKPRGFVAWLGIGTAVASVVRLGCSLLIVYLSSGEYDLVVWIQEQTAVYPSKATDDTALPLSFESGEAESVTVVKINVANLGSRSVGKQDAIWRLSITAKDDAARLAILGEVEWDPKNTIVRLVTQASPGPTVAFELGVLQPRAHIDFRLMVVNAPRAGRVRFHATSSLLGLPEPHVERKPLSQRLGKRLAPWIAAIFFLVFLLEAVQEWRKNPEALSPRRKGVGVVVKRLGLCVVVATLAGFLAGGLLGWVLAFFV